MKELIFWFRALSFFPDVSPIRLPTHSMAGDLMEGRKATLSGWGRTSDDSGKNQKTRQQRVCARAGLPPSPSLCGLLSPLIAGACFFSGEPDVSPDLKFVELEVSTGRVCSNYYGSTWLLNKICISTKDGKSSCRGDGGSPFALREADGNWTVVGLVSFGAADGCTLGLPVVFTHVASFLDFVEDATGIVARD